MALEGRWDPLPDRATVRRSNRGWTVVHLYRPDVPTGALKVVGPHFDDLTEALTAAEQRNVESRRREAGEVGRRPR